MVNAFEISRKNKCDNSLIMIVYGLCLQRATDLWEKLPVTIGDNWTSRV